MSSTTFLLMYVIGSIVNGQLMNLILFPKNTNGGQCMDGSPAGFYYSPPPSGSSDLWVIHIAGGGGCWDKISCDQRANGPKGSSKNWSPTHKGSNELSNDASINPDFYQGHKILCQYCSSDEWTGQRHTPSAINPDTWGYIFGGHLIFEKIAQYAADNLGLLDAQYVFLTGNSAGGLGLFANVDWFGNELKQKAKNKDLVYKASPKSGWFFPGNTTDQLNDPMMPPNDYPHWVKHENGGTGHDDSIDILYDAYYNPKCAAALGANASWNCGSVHNLYQYIETPLFVMENKYDTNQLVDEFGLPTGTVNNETIGYVEYFGLDMDRSIITQMIDEKNESNGLFYPSCFYHGTGLGIGNDQNLTTINGYNSSELAGDWFWERNKLPHFVYDTCNNDQNQLPCNPTCRSYPPHH